MTPTQEERMAAMERGLSDHIDIYHRHTVICAEWQSQMNAKLDNIYRELNGRLPKWASMGAIVTFSLLTGIIGWLAKSAGL